jgi:hypothetical protein
MTLSEILRLLSEVKHDLAMQEGLADILQRRIEKVALAVVAMRQPETEVSNGESRSAGVDSGGADAGRVAR